VSPPADSDTFDVAIVGGGVSGAYLAWRLSTIRPRDLSPELSARAARRGGRLRIGLFESSQRIGGRLFSVSLPGVPGVKAELGGMRFLNSHQRVVRLAKHFGLGYRPLRVDDPEGRNLYYLRGQHFRGADWERPDFVPPYRLERGERCRSPGRLLMELALRHRHRLTDRPWEYRNIGFWNLLLAEYSDQAYHLIRDAGGYESIVGNWSAADAIPYLLADFAEGLEYYAFDDGFQELPRRMVQAFERHQGATYLGHALHHIENDSTAGNDHGFALTFDQSPPRATGRRANQPIVVQAHHVVLALPRRAIERLHPDSMLFDSEQFCEDLAAVLPQPAFKIFTCYERPWWKRARGVVAGRTVTDLPMRQCYYWVTGAETVADIPWVTGQPQPAGSRDGHSVLMASYNDGSSVEFWKGLARQSRRYMPPAEVCPPGVPIPLDMDGCTASAALVEELQRQLREVHGLGNIADTAAADIIAPYAAVWRDWTEEPFGGGWHFWKVGIDSARVMRRMRHPYEDRPLFVCGEAWSPQQGWVEGALESADHVLRDYFLS